MLTIKKSLLFLTVCLLLLLFIEDELDPASVELISAATPDGANSAWFYLMGIATETGTHPLYAGRQRYLSIISAEAAMNRNRDELKLKAIPGALSLQAPEGEIHCGLHMHSCLQNILDNKQSIAFELNKHSLLLDRYQAFMAMRDFRSLTSFGRELPTPPFQRLIDGSRLLGLDAIHRSMNGEHAIALNILAKNEINIRSHMASADDLVFKLILSAMLSENIDRLVVVNHLSGRQGETIAPLNHLEKSYHLALAREYKMMKYTIDDIYTRQKHDSLGYATVAPFMRLILKPNISVNTQRHTIEASIAQSELNPLNFQLSASSPVKSNLSATAWLRNLVGSFIIHIAPIDFRPHIARSFDLDAKISLYNYQANNSNLSSQDQIDTFINPYYQKTGFSYAPDRGGYICLNGPFDNWGGSQCLLNITDSALPDKHVYLSDE